MLPPLFDQSWLDKRAIFSYREGICKRGFLSSRASHPERPRLPRGFRGPQRSRFCFVGVDGRGRRSRRILVLPADGRMTRSLGDACLSELLSSPVLPVASAC